MCDDYKIYGDAGQPATLNNGAGVLTDCATLQEAVLAWHLLAPEEKIRATVKVIGGPVYRAHEIERLHYEPNPPLSAALDEFPMSIDKQSSKMTFVCDVCSARFEAETTDQQPGRVHALWIAAEKLGWHVRQQRGGKWHTACPKCATDDWKLWNW